MRKIKLPILYTLSFLASTLPVLIYFIVNYDSYVKTTPEKVKLLFGGILAVGILILKTIGFLKIKSGVVVFGIIFVFAYLLESIINDLLIFSFLALSGEILSLVIKIFILKEREKINMQKGEELVERAISRASGRV